jgi:hypothetical protein
MHGMNCQKPAETLAAFCLQLSPERLKFILTEHWPIAYDRPDVNGSLTYLTWS